MDTFLAYLQQLGDAAYWLLLLVTLGESFVLAGIFVPGTTVLVFMGALAQFGYYDYPQLALFAIVGGIIGNAVSYEMGRTGRFRVGNVSFVHRQTHSATAFVNKYKALSIFLSRFIGPIRPIVPFVAGMGEMGRGRFYAYTFISSIVWCASYLALGYAFNFAWQAALAWSSVAVAGVVVLFVLFIGSFRLLRKKTIEKI